FAGGLLPKDTSIPDAVDHCVGLALEQQGVKPAPQTSDANLIRRLTLDLHGRIPAASEVKAFRDSKHPNKRAELVDRLMNSPGFARNHVNELDAMLMQGSGGDLREYLTKAVGENRPWDRVFRELMLIKETDPKDKASEFLKRRVGDLDKLTVDVSVRFFGVNISCAKCHDHPEVEDWKQDRFYGMKSFFNRYFENGDFVGEREYGIVKFKTTEGEEHQAKPTFLTGAVLDEPETPEPSAEDQKKHGELLKKLAKEKKPPPSPKFSRRRLLVEAALKQGEDRFFSRSIVNRLWKRMFGHGLVTPLDQMHEENSASHPELLDWLARDLISHGYDLKRTIRGLALSQAYSRSSQWMEGQRPHAWLFAVAEVKPLTPRQFGASLRMASTDPHHFPAEMDAEKLTKNIESTAAGGESAGNLFEAPGEDFQVSVSEALLFSNNERVSKDYFSDGGGKLVSRLKQIEDPKEVIETAVWNVLSREPDAEEMKLLSAYLEKRGDRKTEACRQIVWALMTSAEFRFNH
ncbi:MAG: DUF1549 and DUF1553 domain-containing protein, partial [Planctomycetales bacterium]